MLRLIMNGLDVVRDAEWAAQQDVFRKRHAVQFKRFVALRVSERLGSMLRAAGDQFQPLDHRGDDGRLLAREAALPDDAPLATFLFLLLNQPRLFTAIGEFTGSGETIRSFDGRCNRLSPGGEHFNTWHNDLGHGRRFGLSVNLSVEPVTGGELQIRLRDSREIVQTITPGRFGDATLLRLAPSLEHRVCPVRGASPRCCYSGWFTTEQPRSR